MRCAGPKWPRYVWLKGDGGSLTEYNDLVNARVSATPEGNGQGFVCAPFGEIAARSGIFRETFREMATKMGMGT